MKQFYNSMRNMLSFITKLPWSKIGSRRRGYRFSACYQFASCSYASIKSKYLYGARWGHFRATAQARCRVLLTGLVYLIAVVVGLSAPLSLLIYPSAWLVPVVLALVVFASGLKYSVHHFYNRATLDRRFGNVCLYFGLGPTSARGICLQVMLALLIIRLGLETGAPVWQLLLEISKPYSPTYAQLIGREVQQLFQSIDAATLALLEEDFSFWDCSACERRRRLLNLWVGRINRSIAAIAYGAPEQTPFEIVRALFANNAEDGYDKAAESAPRGEQQPGEQNSSSPSQDPKEPVPSRRRRRRGTKPPLVGPYTIAEIASFDPPLTENERIAMAFNEHLYPDYSNLDKALPVLQEPVVGYISRTREAWDPKNNVGLHPTNYAFAYPRCYLNRIWSVKIGETWPWGDGTINIVYMAVPPNATPEERLLFIKAAKWFSKFKWNDPIFYGMDFPIPEGMTRYDSALHQRMASWKKDIRTIIWQHKYLCENARQREKDYLDDQFEKMVPYGAVGIMAFCVGFLVYLWWNKDY